MMNGDDYGNEDLCNGDIWGCIREKIEKCKILMNIKVAVLCFSYKIWIFINIKLSLNRRGTHIKKKKKKKLFLLYVQVTPVYATYIYG